MLLPDEKTNGWPAGETPILADELQLSLDVIDEEGHVTVQIEIGYLKNEGITEDGHAADTVNFARAQRTDWT